MSHASSQELTAYVPHGLVVTRAWLRGQGLSPHTLDNWRKSGRLEGVAHGVFKQPGMPLTWQGIVASLQRMGVALMPGGMTALELHGLAHYVPLGAQQPVHLYGAHRLPLWVHSLLPQVRWVAHKGLSSQDQSVAFPSGLIGWELQVATPERAVFEVMDEVPEDVSFEHADALFQGLATLLPGRIAALLETYPSIKAKRLFLWFAQRHRHPWLLKLDGRLLTLQTGHLGTGKRVLIKGGRLDPTYLITVPRDLHG